MSDDNRKELFDKLGELILSISTEITGEQVAKTGAIGLGCYQEIVQLLRTSQANGKYEHALQRGSDIEAGMISLRDDYRISENMLFAMKRDYGYMRTNAHAGRFPGLELE